MSNEGTEYESTVYTDDGSRLHSCFARTEVAHSESEMKNRKKNFGNEKFLFSDS